MPAVTDEAKRNLRAGKRKKKLESYIRELIKDSSHNQAECGKAIGLSQGGFSIALKNMSFNAKDLIVLFDYLEADPEEIASILARS